MDPIDPRVKAVYVHEARLRMCRELHTKFQPLIYALPHTTEEVFMWIWTDALAQEQRDLNQALDRSVPVFKEQIASHV